MLSFLNNASLLNTILILCLSIGGFFAFRNGKRTELARFQKETIDALQQRIESLEGKISDVEKENIVQRHVIDTITSALKQRGMIVSIDGDMVTISDKSGMSSTHRKRTITTQSSASITEKKEI